MKIAVVDTYYGSFLKGLPPPTGNYAVELLRVLHHSFGTFDAFSRNLRLIGHEAIDIIANYRELQEVWASEHGVKASGSAIALEQIRRFQPDVVFLQDLSYFTDATLAYLRSHYLLAGQCSCPLPPERNLRQMHMLFTSFPHYVAKFEALGVQAEYLPLAFDAAIFQRLQLPQARVHVSFVGGYGPQWKADRLLMTLAERTPIEFWGYGFEDAQKRIHARWHGEAWGLEMYRIYLSSNIVVNRHIGVAQGYSNNLRMFEATGCGAMLLTEDSPNIRSFFSEKECVTYTSPEDAAEKINHYLAHPADMLAIASAGQRRTLNEHNYPNRMKQMVKALELAKVNA